MIIENYLGGVLVHHGVKGQKWGVRRTPEQLGHDSTGTGLHVTIDETGHYISEKGFAIHGSKITGFCLKPGSKHYGDFEAVGYKPSDGDRLIHDIEDQFDLENKTDSRVNKNTGKEEFSIPMQLGADKKHTFRTTWIVDRHDGLPRFTTAFHDEDLGKKER